MTEEELLGFLRAALDDPRSLQPPLVGYTLSAVHADEGWFGVEFDDGRRLAVTVEEA